MVSNLSYDTICHEHLLYLRLGDVKEWCFESEKDFISLEFNKINGGRFAFTTQKRSSGEPAKLQLQITQVLENELLESFNLTLAALRKFERSVEIHKSNSQSEITKLRQRGGEIYGLGASTKGDVLLQTLGPAFRAIVAIGEVNPKKCGLFTPGTNRLIFQKRY